MTCFIMYSQIILFELNYNQSNHKVTYFLTTTSAKCGRIIQILQEVCVFISIISL